MEHFITKIHIEQVRHLKNIDIELSRNKRKHLILTGKNGSGKTSLLNAIKRYLQKINEGAREGGLIGNRIPDYETELKRVDVFERENRQTAIPVSFRQEHSNDLSVDIEMNFDVDNKLENLLVEGKFITAFFPADRLTKISVPQGVEDIKLKTMYGIGEQPVGDFVKYLVHLKTQQAYAKNEGDNATEKSIEDWFVQFEKAIQTLMEDDSISLKYDYKNYNFIIQQKGKNSFGFNELSDGFSAAICILADLLMRMDQGWLLNSTVLNKTVEGVVLIDEIETHLHLELQKSILPFLTNMFPNLQFIVTTHSPFVVNSLDDTVIYDLENGILVTGGLSNVTYEGIVEGYFRADTLSILLRNKFERYKTLIQKTSLSDDDYDEIMSLEQYLNEIPDYLSIGIAEEYGKLKLEFQAREDA
ncbi:MAG: AAA family ATPase [Clostridia bacterium]|nr:AAA family ATPase [Clostridia bacterium]